jgi:hypothetical protein
LFSRGFLVDVKRKHCAEACGSRLLSDPKDNLDVPSLFHLLQIIKRAGIDGKTYDTYKIIKLRVLKT